MVLTSVVPAVAQEATPQYVKRSAALMAIGNGNEKYLGRSVVEDATNNDTNRRAGPGFEQATIAHMVGPDQAHYVVVIVMESVIPKEGLGPYQLSCSAFRLNEKGSPTMVAARKFLTQNAGNRPANHPKAVTVSMPDGLQYVAYAYGSQMGTNRTKTFFGVTNHNCDKLLADPKISHVEDEANNDRGAPDIAFHGVVGDAAVLSFGYFSNGNDDGTYIGALELRGSGGLLDVKSKYTPKMILGPSNIGRPALAADGAGRALMCAPVEGNRPAHHVSCANIDINTGDTVFKDYIAKGVLNGDPYKRKYMGQPTITRIADGQFAVQILESNGAAKTGRQENLKGSNKSHLHYVTMNPGTGAFAIKATLDDAAVQPTHAAICGGKFGVDGKPTIAVVSAPPTGIGRGHMLMVHFDGSQAQPFKYEKAIDAWPINYNADSGFLANAYGDNPYQQGRDFLRCIGDVPNPGYGKPGGFMPDVKSFWAAAIPGREVGQIKNSLYLSLLPAETDTPGMPGNPVNAQDVPLPTPAPTSEGPKTDSGCGCSAPGTNAHIPGFVALGIMAAGAVVIRYRRRREEN
jgi:hypothetical protein